MAEKKQSEQLYGIGAAARLTGLSDHTIRIWERRYRAVVARRAANKRRLFTAGDVEKLGLLKLLTDQGIAIGQIAGENVEELRSRARGIESLSRSAALESIRIAVLGDLLPSQLRTHPHELRPLEVIIAELDRKRFEADLDRHRIDVVVLETATLGADTAQRLRALMRRCGARSAVIVYRFARARDISRTANARTVLLRGPVGVDELRAAVIRAATQDHSERKKPARDRIASDRSDWKFGGPPAPRRFDRQQLASLATASTEVDCECPHHLVRLVGDLSAFEVYSAECAHRDDDDAALHRYLHHTTAEARALIETALARLADAEGLKY